MAAESSAAAEAAALADVPAVSAAVDPQEGLAVAVVLAPEAAARVVAAVPDGIKVRFLYRCTSDHQKEAEDVKIFCFLFVSMNDLKIRSII